MLAVALMLSLQGSVVSTNSLLDEMSNLDRLTRRGGNQYRTVEASSYDRASVSPTADGWFANADYGKYLRSELNEGRTEWVMGDFEGPGAMVRFWSANPMGIVRFYFDGSAKPRVEAKMVELLQGKVKPWDDQFAYNAARGTNLYYPFPFAKRLKVTVSEAVPGERLNAIYYQLNTRLYEEGTKVVTHGQPDSYKPISVDPIMWDSASIVNLAGFSSQTWKLKSDDEAEIFSFVITPQWKTGNFTPADAQSIESRLKQIEVGIAFDGQETVRVPLPDLFGAGVLPAKLHTLMSRVSDRELECRLPMPFQQAVSFKFTNHSKIPISFKARAFMHGVTGPRYTLHAQWTADMGRSRPMRDMNLVNFFGEGRYVGTVMHVQNPTQAWWGEGDEKVWVDGERFPSWIGTGTEDYFGYAWSNPEVFSRPYHGQARADGPGCGGQIGNVRWHIMDDIPFKKKIRFDIEQWHWEDVPSRFDMTAFWYAKPGKWTAPPLDLEGLKIIDGPKPPAPLKGAIEGETMRIVSASGGKTERQAFNGLSSGQQLWWKEGKDGDSLVLEFDSTLAGSRRLTANLCHAKDYGIQELFLNGVSLGVTDFYSPELVWNVVDLGSVSVRKGKNELRVVCRGSNSKANPPSRMFGLDYLMLK